MAVERNALLFNPQLHNFSPIAVRGAVVENKMGKSSYCEWKFSSTVCIAIFKWHLLSLEEEWRWKVSTVFKFFFSVFFSFSLASVVETKFFFLCWVVRKREWESLTAFLLLPWLPHSLFCRQSLILLLPPTVSFEDSKGSPSSKDGGESRKEFFRIVRKMR